MDEYDTNFIENTPAKWNIHDHIKWSGYAKACCYEY